MTNEKLKTTIFGRLFIGYTLLYIFAILGIGIITYGITITSHSSNVRELQEVTFTSLCESVTTIFKRLEETGYKIAESEQVRDFLNEDSTQDNTYYWKLNNLSVYISNTIDLDSYINSVTVYSVKQNTLFFSNEYHRSGIDAPHLRHTLESILVSGKNTGWTHIEKRRTDILPWDEAFCVFVKSPVFNLDKNGVILLKLNNTVLGDYLEALVPDDLFFAITHNGRTIISNKPDLLLKDKNHISFTDTESSNVHTQPVKNEKNWYFYMRPLRNGFVESKKLHIWFILTIAFFALGIIPIIYLLLRKIYRPLRQYITLLKSTTGKLFIKPPNPVFKNVSEIRDLTSILDDFSKLTEDVIKKSEKERWNYFLKSIIHSPETSEHFPEEYKTLSNMFRNKQLCVSLVEEQEIPPSGYGNKDHSSGPAQIKNSEFDVIVIPLSHSSTAFLHEHDTTHISSMITRYLDTHRTKIVTGKPVSGIKEIYQSYKDATDLLKYKIEKMGCMNRKTIVDLSTSQIETIHLEMEKFRKHLFSMHKENTLHSIRKLNDILMNCILPDDSIHVIIMTILSIQKQFCGQKLPVQPDISGYDFLHSPISRRLTMLEKNVENAFYALDSKNNSEASTGKLVHTYITEHFCDPLISLKQVSDHFCVSESTVSRSLKEETGTTFKEILTSRRIEKAKELIIDQYSVSVAETAKAVGYLDYHSFIRCFKKYSGMSPTEFKNQFHQV